MIKFILILFDVTIKNSYKNNSLYKFFIHNYFNKLLKKFKIKDKNILKKKYLN